MKVWVTTIQPPGCDAHIFGVHYTWEGAWAKLSMEYYNVHECRGANGKCECDFDIKVPHYHGTAEMPWPENGEVEVGGQVGREIFWTADQVDIE